MRGSGRGLDRIGLAVADLDQARPGIRVAFIRAPDEVLVELIERRDPCPGPTSPTSRRHGIPA